MVGVIGGWFLYFDFLGGRENILHRWKALVIMWPPFWPYWCYLQPFLAFNLINSYLSNLYAKPPLTVALQRQPSYLYLHLWQHSSGSVPGIQQLPLVLSRVCRSSAMEPRCSRKPSLRESRWSLDPMGTGKKRSKMKEKKSSVQKDWNNNGLRRIELSMETYHCRDDRNEQVSDQVARALPPESKRNWTDRNMVRTS